jgi:flagellar hook-associated protein 1 FlgK
MPSLQDMALVGKSGLIAQQQKMATISQNLANTSTAGYHRRQSVLGTAPTQPGINPYTLENGPKLGGVTVLDVVRAYNATQESLLRTEQSSTEFHTQKGAALTDLESLLGGGSADALDARLQAFWNGWQDVANNPTNLAARSALIETSASLTSSFQALDQRLSAYRDGIAALDTAATPVGTVPRLVDDINAMTGQIQSINRRITLSGPNAKPYDLLDERDRLLSELAQRVDITVASDGAVSLDGQLLVSGDGLTANRLSVTATTGATITFALDGSAVTPKSGQLGAWLDATATVQAWQTTVDTLADALLNGVNDLHTATASFDLDGNAGIPFFTGTDTDGDGLVNAGTLDLNSAIRDPANPANNAPRAIAAAASRYAAGSPNAADGHAALQIAQLAEAAFTALDGQTLSASFNRQLTTLGAAIRSANEDATNATSVAQMLTNAIQQESGVNTDEEMIDMITSQRAYQAAAKLISTINEMLGTVLSMGGTP